MTIQLIKFYYIPQITNEDWFWSCNIVSHFYLVTLKVLNLSELIKITRSQYIAYENQEFSQRMPLTLSELSKPGYLQRIYSTSNSKAAIQNPIICYLRAISDLLLSKIS